MTDPRVPSETLYVVSAYEDGADYRLCRNFAEIRAAYIELCCGSDDPWHQDEINAAMAAIADEDNWNVDSVSVGVGDCGQFQVTKYPAHLFRALLAQAEPVGYFQENEPGSYEQVDPQYKNADDVFPLYAAPSCAEHDRLAQWISVSERLPEESRQLTRNTVLAYFNWGIRRDELPSVQLAEISCGHWRPISGNGDFDQYVTHWMPLPSAPESEERNGQ